MDIAGGLYRELCETPRWDAVLGSGGRAARALSDGSYPVRLHTYIAPAHDLAADGLRALGVEVIGRAVPGAVAFSYLHPLSDPHIEPPRDAIALTESLVVEAEAILRFGFLEGDAVVDARHAVFDPQTARHAAAFHANGSRADHLALVLNEGELRARAHSDDVQTAAIALMEADRAEVVVVKRGVKGALVLTHEGAITHVPAYRSSSVFKIGTGDVFSAVFAHLWAERRLTAAAAADGASRAVAAYAETKELPPPNLDALSPILAREGVSRVLLLGKSSSLGRRFVLEEARFVLRDMGLEVSAPGLGDPFPVEPHAVLAVAEALPAKKGAGPSHIWPNVPVILLDEAGDGEMGDVRSVDRCTDFSTALYKTAWAASERRKE